MNKRVLVVDDDPAIRTLLCTVLRRQGLQVDSAVDGMDALDKARTMEGLALILLDLMMPNLDGPGFLTALRALNLPHTPMIVVITAGHEIEIEKLDRTLVAGLVRKPFDIFEVGSLVNEILLECGEPSAENSSKDPSLLMSSARLPISGGNDQRVTTVETPEAQPPAKLRPID